MAIKKAIVLLIVMGMLAFVAADVASKNTEKSQTEYTQQRNTTIKTTTKLR